MKPAFTLTQLIVELKKFEPDYGHLEVYFDGDWINRRASKITIDSYDNSKPYIFLEEDYRD